ncbi:ATP-binding cassette domain-containing protein [Arthrobacter sp. 2MCAF15]|uniref:ATP-binding cassette domain-containing protein n=1 Tax=Arthrobacter sp. 2MCAF15 TaxID=3232984 RepID=UPI003F8F7C37
MASRRAVRFTAGPAVPTAVRLIFRGWHRPAAFLGRHTCGKSTLLKVVAGLTRASDRTVELRGQKVKGPDGTSACQMQIKYHPAQRESR